jgi:hypothetical protein
MMRGRALLCVGVEKQMQGKIQSPEGKAGKSKNVKKKVLVKIRQACVISVKGAPFYAHASIVGLREHDWP